MDPQAALETMLREIRDHDEDAACESFAILLGWVRKGGFPPDFKAAWQKIMRDRC